MLNSTTLRAVCKVFIGLGLVLGLSGIGHSACTANGPATYTTRAGIKQPAINNCGWGNDINANMGIIDSSAAFMAQPNTFTSTQTFNQPIIIGNQQAVRFYDGSTHYISFQSPTSMVTQVITWPATAGTAGQTMITDGNGNLSWSGAGGGGSFINNSGSLQTGALFSVAGGNGITDTTNSGTGLTITESGSSSVGLSVVQTGASGKGITATCTSPGTDSCQGVTGTANGSAATGSTQQTGVNGIANGIQASVGVQGQGIGSGINYGAYLTASGGSSNHAIGTGSGDFSINGQVGTSGQVLTSQGSNISPIWTSVASNAIISTNVLQSGTTFFVSSGSISGSFTQVSNVDGTGTSLNCNSPDTGSCTALFSRAKGLTSTGASQIVAIEGISSGTAQNFGVVGEALGTSTNTAGQFVASGGTLNHALVLSGGDLQVSGSAGTSGQVLTSQGSNAQPNWTTISASGGGTSSLAVSSGSASNSVQVSSPTSKIVVDSNTIIATLQGTTTTFLQVNPASATLQGPITAATLGALTTSSASTTYFNLASTPTLIWNTSSLQLGATFYVSSGTLGSLNGGNVPILNINGRNGEIIMHDLGTTGTSDDFYNEGLWTHGARAAHMTVADTNSQGEYGWTWYTDPSVELLNANINTNTVNVKAPGGLATTYGVAGGSLTINGSSNGNIQLTVSGSTYTVTSTSNTGTGNVTVGHMAVWASTNATLTDGGAPGAGGGGSGTVGSGTPPNLAYYTGSTTVGSASGIQWSGSSMTVTSSVTIGGAGNSNAPFMSILDTTTSTGDSNYLFDVGSSNSSDQFIIENGAFIDTKYGIYSGRSAMQLDTNSFPGALAIYNNGTDYIDLGGATPGQITIQTTSGNQGNGTGNPIVFNPTTVTAVSISSYGVTVSTQATFISSVTIKSPLSMNSNLINNVTNPVNAQDAATKNYVDTSVTGLDYKGAAYLGTAAALPLNLYNNGASGVGATLTGVSFGALTVDGQAVSTTQRILVKNEANQVNNGIYSVTTAGSGIAAYVLTRTADYNQSSEIQPGDAVFVTSGTLNASTGWVMNNETFTTVGTSTITWSQFSGPGSGVTALQATGNPYITGVATLIGGTNVTLSQSGSSVTIIASGSGGGGSSTLGVSSGSATSSVIVSSPTSNVVFDSNTLSVALQGTTTSFVKVNPALSVSSITAIQAAFLPAATFFWNLTAGRTTPSANLSSVTVVNGFTTNIPVGGGSTGIVVNQLDTTNNPAGEIINSTGTNNGLIVNANGVNYGTNNTSGAFAVNCGQWTQGNCATVYNDGGAQNVLNGAFNIIQDSPTWNTVTAYMISGADNPQNGWRLDGYDYSTLELIDTLKNRAGPAGGGGTVHNGKFQISSHNGQMRGEMRAADNSGFIPGWQLADSTATGVMAVGHVYGVPTSTLDVEGGMVVGYDIAGPSGSGLTPPTNGVLVEGSEALKGGVYFGTHTISATTYTIASTDTVVFASATLGAISTMTLPSAASACNNGTGQIIQITKVDSSTATVNIVTSGSDLINGTTPQVSLNLKGQTDELVSDCNSKWWPHGQGITSTMKWITGGGNNQGLGLPSSSATLCNVIFNVPYEMQASSITVEIQTADTTASHKYSFGVVPITGGYSVLYTTPTSITGGSLVDYPWVQGPTILMPGQYVLCWTGMSTVGQFYHGSSGAQQMPPWDPTVSLVTSNNGNFPTYIMLPAFNTTEGNGNASPGLFFGIHQ